MPVRGRIRSAAAETSDTVSFTTVRLRGVLTLITETMFYSFERCFCGSGEFFIKYFARMCIGNLLQLAMARHEAVI
jgi:hypothetical protein